MFRNLIIITFLLLISSLSAYSCVGKILNIGIIDNKEQLVVSELLSVMVTERTGTTVKITKFSNSKSLYDAVRKGDVGMIVEPAEDAISNIKSSNGSHSVDSAKNEYRKNYGLIWLEPWKINHRYTPMISTELLASLPALPRLVNKLPNAVSNESFQKLIKVNSNEVQIKKSAKEFLKLKKLI